MRQAISLGIIALLFMFATEPVSAGNNSIDVQPTKVEVAATARTSSVTLTNNGTNDKLYQAAIYNWNQSANKDQLALTHDIIVYPPVIPIAAGATKIIRLGFKPIAGNNEERAYRLVLTEVAQKANNNLTGMQMSYQFNVPVFMAPPGKVTSDLSWTASLDASHTHLSLVLKNNGSTHIAAQDVNIYSDFAGTVQIGTSRISNDLLAGTTSTYEFALSKAITSSAITGKLELIQGVVVKFSVPIS